MHSYTAIIVYIGVLSMFTQEFSLVMQVHECPELKPNKKLSVPIFLVKMGPTKKKFTLVRPRPPPTTGFPELYSNGYLNFFFNSVLFFSLLPAFWKKKKKEHWKNFEHFDETERKRLH